MCLCVCVCVCVCACVFVCETFAPAIYHHLLCCRPQRRAAPPRRPSRELPPSHHVGVEAAPVRLEVGGLCARARGAQAGESLWS